MFGIWGDDGPHSRLTFRVATKRKSPLWIRCLQNTKAEQLEQFLRSNGVYVASQNEAESALRQQLEAFDKPQWDMYERRKFAVDITPSTGGLLAVCAACYNARAGEPRCEGTFQVRKVVLRPFKHKEYQVSLIPCPVMFLLNKSRSLHIELVAKPRMKGLSFLTTHCDS